MKMNISGNFYVQSFLVFNFLMWDMSGFPSVGCFYQSTSHSVGFFGVPNDSFTALFVVIFNFSMYI